MKEVIIEFDNKNPVSVNEEVNIQVGLAVEENIKFKFIEGYDKVWTPIQDFSESKICRWKPEKPGKYMFLVQAKVEGSKKPYDYLGKAEFEVKDETKLIKNVNVEKNKVYVGDKVTLAVDGSEELLLYRFWIRGKHDWEILRDYTAENKYVFTTNSAGTKEILVECKRVNSENNVDDYSRVKIEVKDLCKIDIKNFICLSKKLIVNEELIFKVEANYENNRPLLYKFIKISNDGRMSCIQDFSSKSTVAYKEQEAGKYKLLCMVRDIFSNKDYDDRAVMVYDVEPYDEVKIRSFKADLESPQPTGTRINLNSNVEGGRELLYRYIIDGPVQEDSGFIRSSQYLWKASEEGKYNITLKVRDISCKGDYEDIRSIAYQIDKKGDKPVRIVDLKCDKGRRCLIGQPININVKTEGGSKVLYKFILFKDGVQIEERDFSKSNWIDFIPEKNGEYEIEVRVKDFYSIKEFDSSSSIYIKAADYIPAEIDYVLTTSKEIFLIHDTVEIEPIIQHTKDVVVKFVTKINGQEVENTGFVENKALRVKPKCSGKYTFQVFAKNKKSNEEYDSKKEISIYVQDSVPVNSTKVFASTTDIKVGKEVTFEANSIGGRDLCYEFYIMKDGNWVLVQEYGKKNYYTFLPFSQGEYRLLVLCKSFYKKVNYEDYEIVSFNVS